MNLIDNCAKYGPEGGVVTVDLATSSRDPIVVRVSDEGPGVPPELRERIFEKYAQAERGQGMRSSDSRGLGLRFCKVVVDTHGGRIWAEDAEPRGARFCVELRSA
jgi:K+-sensing histidine kinase KdpD